MFEDDVATKPNWAWLNKASRYTLRGVAGSGTVEVAFVEVVLAHEL
jgi:hypothetical protein